VNRLAGLFSVLKPECVFDELVVQERVLVLLLLRRQANGNVNVVGEHHTNLDHVLLNQIEVKNETGASAWSAAPGPWDPERSEDGVATGLETAAGRG
jgi:hypothetical protein